MCSTSGKKPQTTAEQVQGKKIAHVSRVGKYIVFKLDDGYLISHLRMTGQWHFTPSDKPGPNSNKHFRWGFTIRGHDGNFSGFLWFKDVRKFGTMVWVENLKDYEPFSRMGPDGLQLNDPKAVFKIVLAAEKSKRPIKNLLLDQKVIGGVGNIYSSETLFEARVNPKTPSKELPKEKIGEICRILYRIFRQSIDMGGSSISDYVGGRYHDVLSVYGRAGEACYECDTKIERLIQAGRSTFYCPKCQREEENEHF